MSEDDMVFIDISTLDNNRITDNTNVITGKDIDEFYRNHDPMYRMSLDVAKWNAIQAPLKTLLMKLSKQGLGVDTEIEEILSILDKD